MAALAHTVVSHAFTNATRPALMVPMAVGLVGAALTTFMRSPRRSVASEESAAEAAGQAKPAAGAPAPAFAPVLASETIALPAVPHQLQPMVPLRAIRPPFLVQIGDPSRAERAIKNTLVLGRQAGSDLVVQDPRVSRRHAEIASVDGACVVRDLNSANGTWVNDALVASDQRLHDGDVIRVGSTVFVYHDDREIARPRLVQTGGERRGVYFIRTSLSIGRLSGNDVVLEDRRVSRRHAQVALRDGGIYLRDLNSLNGTRVNGVLATGDHLLVNGDVIRLGEASFVYHNDLEAPNAA
jgi:pSer/pThr/pTyr-binding forkhead associated (FHA) protein